MPPKTTKDQKGRQLFRVGTPLKDVIPQSVKNPPRDPKPLKAPEQINKQSMQEYHPFPDPEDWPGDEVVQALNLLQGEAQLTKCNFETDKYVPFWRRPKNFLRQRWQQESEHEPPYMEMRENRYNMNDDYYSTRLETIEKIHFMEKEVEHQLTICESYERMETPEEVELRRKEFLEKQAAQQKNKKGNKKQAEEVFDENPKMTSDVRLSDLICNDTLPPNSRWIASQLQQIKDRDIKDCFTQKSLSSKIYPQKDGAPIYNPNGKYIVKLYFMGKERKIQVSDHMPTTFDGKALLPQSVDKNQLWPMIISKAILQLWDYQSKGSLVGDGFVMYSLMGLLTETIDLKTISGWGVIDNMMNNNHYVQKDVFVSTYSYKNQSNLNTNNRSKKEYLLELLRNPKKEYDNYEIARNKNSSPSQHQQIQQEEQDEQQEEIQQDEDEQQIQRFRKSQRGFSFESLSRSYSIPRPSIPPGNTNLNTCFSYSIVEQFQNENGFNMVYAQKRSDRELRLRQEYFDLCKTPMNKMTKEEKLELRRRKKEIKEKLQDDDKKRISLISQQPVKHRYLRLKSDVQGKDPVIVFSPLAADEIYIAKKCIANKLNKPPNYDIPEIKGDDKSVVSANMKNTDDSFTVKPLEDFSSVNNAQEPFNRGEGGFWVHEKEFLSLFDYIQIAYDPKRYNLQILQIQSNPDNDIANYDNIEMIIVQRDQDSDDNAQVAFLYGFQPKYSQDKDLNEQIRPYSMLQRFDLETYESILDYKLLNQCVSSQMLLLDNKNHIFKMNIYSPLNFTIWFASNNKINTQSVFDYLIDYENYQKQSFQIDYPSCEANKYYVYFRFKVFLNSNKDNGSFVYRLKSTTDNQLLKFLKVKLCEIPPPDNNLMLTTIEGVHKNLFESESIINGTQRMMLRSQTTYYFILEGTPQYNTQEGTFELDFLINQEFTFTQLENVEPARYYDKYVPTKYGTIFRERIFANEAQASIYVRLTEGQQAQQQQQVAKGKQTKGGAQELEIVESEMKGERLIRLELYHGDDLIVYNYGINSVTLSNITLPKDENYVIQASFDLREWPEAKIKSEETDNLYWFTTIFASDTVALVRDTTKEDKEKAIKKSWEDKEPGRAANAKKSRTKYLITLKEELTPEEQAIVNAPRMTKKQREEEAKQAAQKKGPKKDDKKVGKQTKVEAPVDIVPQQRQIPKSENHVNEAITQFLQHLEQDRIMDHYARHAGLINVRSDVQKREILEGILMGKEEISGIIQRNLQMREEIKLLQKDNKEILINEFQSYRSSYKQELAEIYQQRDSIKQDLTQLMKKEQQLFDLCKQEKVGNPEDVEKLIADPSQLDPILVSAAKQVINNWKIAIIQEKINTALQNFDIDTLQKCVDQIQQLNIEGIDTSAADDMLDEASGNPNFQAEKLAELKKQGKKPNKK
ncbi:unnamed protein product [Paramecium pentaurelia]|uniref:Calpain catalytic domain-containing protein n=1 Tax=Paramecium pentaurelia TaxID=43138 RepID=A0A8S1UIZ0_9CILI|nr:unnamed protein product [Paramecium pentaurelia]